MPGMPDIVLRQGFVKTIALGSRLRRRVNLQPILEALRAGDDLLEIGRRFGMITTDAEARHLEEDWLDDEKGYWPGEPVEEILREAWCTANELVRDLDLPLDAYWVCGSKHFEASVSISADQITLMLHTPPVPDSRDVDENHPDLLDDPTSWLIKWDADRGRALRRPVRYLPNTAFPAVSSGDERGAGDSKDGEPEA